MWTRIAALAGYGMQAGLALAMVLIVAALLPTTEFSRFSVLAAAGQFGAVCGFEWIRIGAMRFYPGANDEAERSERRAIRTLFVRTALAMAAGTGLALLLGLGWQAVLLVTTLALMQALSDLHQTMVRFRGALPRFTRMQLARSLLLFGGTIGGAWIGGTALSALTGLLGGHLVALATNRLFDPLAKGDRPGETAAAALRPYLAYGMPAAMASVLHSGVPVAVRGLLIALLGEGAAAGYLLALDIFQRPLALVSVALNGIFYPDVVREYREQPAATTARKRLFGVNVVALTLLSGLLIAFASELAMLAVRSDLQAAFRTAAPWMIGFFLLRSLVQNVLAVRWHLELRPWLLASVGCADLVFAMAMLQIVIVILPGDPVVLLQGLAAGAVALTLVVGGIQLFLREPLPISLLGGAIFLLGAFVTIAPLPLFSALKIAAAIGLSAIWIAAAYRSLRPPQ